MTAAELIAALEAATGPDRKLDAEIAGLIGVATLVSGGEHTGPAYTASLDAALTLVPAGTTWKVRSFTSGVNFGATIEGDEWREFDHEVYPAPRAPALALCIAALRARFAMPAPVFIYGPPGSGKTSNADALAKHYGKARIMDEWEPGAGIPSSDSLVLTQVEVPGGIPIADALDAMGTPR